MGWRLDHDLGLLAWLLPSWPGAREADQTNHMLQLLAEKYWPPHWRISPPPLYYVCTETPRRLTSQHLWFLISLNAIKRAIWAICWRGLARFQHPWLIPLVFSCLPLLTRSLSQAPPRPQTSLPLQEAHGCCHWGGLAHGRVSPETGGAAEAVTRARPLGEPESPSKELQEATETSPFLSVAGVNNL